MEDNELLEFDGAFPDHLPPEGIFLRNYTERARRAFAIELLQRYVPSKVGSARFNEICQGRAEAAKSSESFFSTCGELAMFMWDRLGYRGLILNRAVTLPTGVIRKYAYGKNMTYIRYDSGKERCWVTYHQGKLPHPGDVLFVSNGPPKTEHVCIFHRVKEDGEWETFDAGQYDSNHLDQECEIKSRRFHSPLLGDRKLHGWVDLSKLELPASANLWVPEA